MVWPALNDHPANEDMGAMVPRSLHAGISDYIEFGRPTGHFLTAVFEGDLFRAAQRADAGNFPRLGDIAKFLIWHAPSGAVGSVEKVQAWIEQGGLTRTLSTPVESESPDVDGSARSR